MLKQRGLPVFSEGSLSDALVLFRRHFLLFHLLYRLRDRLFREGQADIEIHCLKIILVPWRKEEGSLPGRPDSLRDYYLDLTRLEETSRLEVEEMIAGFWRMYGGYDHIPRSLEILGLSEPVSPGEVKRRYRELALSCHPDRGGCAEDFRRISEAARHLLRYKQAADST